jgi:hypothetical protein
MLSKFWLRSLLLASIRNHARPLHNDNIYDPITSSLQRIPDYRVFLRLRSVPVVIDIDHHRLEWIFFLEIQAQIISYLGFQEQ